MASVINTPPIDSVDDQDANGALLAPKQGWRNFFNQVFSVCNAVSQSGTTAQRPVSFLYIGRIYFDTTLGKPIWLESIGPSVWVDATGTPS